MAEKQNKDSNVSVDENDKRTFTEELEVAGGQLVERVTDLVKAGNVRKIIIKSADDNVILETSLTVAAVAGGVMMLTPVGFPLAVLGGIAAAVSRVKVEIVRELTDEVKDAIVEGKKKVKIDGE